MANIFKVASVIKKGIISEMGIMRNPPRDAVENNAKPLSKVKKRGHSMTQAHGNANYVTDTWASGQEVPLATRCFRFITKGLGYGESLKALTGGSLNRVSF